MLGKSLLAATAIVCLSAAPARAFGLRSHLWIADQVYQDLADCHLNIRGVEFKVPDDRCDKIRANREEFMTGSLGPDAFPDLVVGQSIVHPGVENGWQANDWLDHLLKNAVEPEEVAFSWGYGMHYAGDIFAHSYVNNYAGAVFDLRKDGTPNVELRHFRLEKYIDQFLPYRFDPRLLSVPRGFLARQLVLYDYPAGDLGPTMTTRHMVAMRTALGLARRAREVEAPRLEKESRIKREIALEELGELEDELKVPNSLGVPLDRRSPEVRRLRPRDLERLRRKHSNYEDAVDRWRRDKALIQFATDWSADVEAAAELYIKASLDFAERMIAQAGTEPIPYIDQKSMLQPYREWSSCYAPVLRGQPLAVGKAVCEKFERLGADIDFLDAAVRATDGWRVRSFYLTVLQVERYLKEAAARVLLKVGSIADPNVSRLVREIVDPARIDHDALNEAFSGSPNKQLSFVCVSDWIDKDLGLRDSAPTGNALCDKAPRRRMMDPMKFLPLEYALTLAKLSLLDADGVREVARRFGGEPSEMRLGDATHYSVLLDMVKSLDGNHQWSGWSMPFPRKDGYQGPIKYLSAGYGGADESKPGFPFYQTRGLRAGPFTRLFPEPFEGSILSRPEMKPPLYPFRPCPGDPLRRAEGATTLVCPKA